MSQQDSLTTVKEIYDAVARNDLDGILERVTDDVDWAAEAAGNGAPWYGRRTGKEGVAGFFGALGSSVEIASFTPHSFAAADSEVHLLVDWTFRVIATGRETSMTMHHYWRLRDGKVDYFRGSEDTRLTAQAFAA
jgi:ketosteroid isomerase-like protein